ncbi:MAG: penicillin-binding protein 2 [Longimicrobiales bacterium]|nr:penicillin-binding protein 2 [Longimicrobiales bacterium]
MKIYLPHARGQRAQGALIGVALLMGLLAAAFFRVQVLGSTTWTLRAESNRLRQLPLPAPRGAIYDRNGAILADNVPGYAITLLPAPADSIRATLARMSRYMTLSPARIDRVLAELRRYGREVVVDADADFEVVSVLEERRSEFPGVYIEMRPRRRYLAGAGTSHVLGYAGEITAEELESETFADPRYDQGVVVGKTGIERQYEEHLQGERGLRYVEVDAKGRIVGDFAGITSAPATPGKDLRLNLDLDLQRYIHLIFPDSMAGAVVAMDPADGGILALYSAPSFDANAFVGGIDADLWRQLNSDSRKPLYDRSVLGLYAPASTFKPATAAIGLDLGVVTPEDNMPVPCTGAWFWGNRVWHCHLAGGHGYQNLPQAIANSCDIYFYQLGLRIGLDRMLRRATEIGFSRECGVDLPQESRGTFPADRSFWNRVFNYSPQEGEVLSLAIGQGPNDQTPLKMAQFYTALARDGSAPAPAIAQGINLGEAWSLNLAPEHLAALREGLRGVTAPGGTAHYAGTLEHWEVLGKTGTGQNALSVQGLAGDHAWFAAIVGPFGGEPEIVVVTLVEHGESGSRVAAPVATKAADFYLRKKHGIPQDSIQTLGEWVQTRGWPGWYRKRFGGGG